jgi:hypothetical protein
MALASLSEEECTQFAAEEDPTGEVGRGRSVFQLATPIFIAKDRSVSVVQISAPKEKGSGPDSSSGLQHVGYVISDSIHPSESVATVDHDDATKHQATLQVFMHHYPDAPWNTLTPSSHPLNPAIGLSLEDVLPGCSVKFNVLPLARVIEYKQSREQQ